MDDYLASRKQALEKLDILIKTIEGIQFQKGFQAGFRAALDEIAKEKDKPVSRRP